MRRLLLASAALLAACATPAGTHESPPPPSLDEVAVKTIETAMTRMARHVRAIELLAATRQGAEITPDERTLILAKLDEVEKESRSLDRKTVVRTHPALVEQLEGFHEDLRLAKEELAATPPNADALQRVTTACSRCHVPRR